MSGRRKFWQGETAVESVVAHVAPRLRLLSRATRLHAPKDFRSLPRLPKECSRHPTQKTPASISSSTSLGHGCPCLYFLRKLPSSSRQGHATVAHRFNGGKAIPTKTTSPVRDGRRLRKPGAERRSMRSHRASICRPCRGCELRANRGPTAEAVGSCRVSLAGQRQDKDGPAVASLLGRRVIFQCSTPGKPWEGGAKTSVGSRPHSFRSLAGKFLLAARLMPVRAARRQPAEESGSFFTRNASRGATSPTWRLP